MIDFHKNTIVTARAGSGKTRVIVAKIVFLIAKCGYDPKDIQVFMFNRTAAAEVNQRISAVKVDGKTIAELIPGISDIKVASTFHKFAHDLLRLSGQKFQLINEADQQQAICQVLNAILIKNAHRTEAQLTQQELLKACHISAERYADLSKIATSFATRAGQKYPDGLPKTLHRNLTAAERLGTQVFRRYLRYLREHSATTQLIDFNILMNRAAKLLQMSKASQYQDIRRLRFIMVDEYQDFSFLFWQLIVAIRSLAPAARLFVVGDDWQAINRFAGSDVDYFLNFHQFFPNDCVKLPISTNYRSEQAIVEEANRFMLSRYDAKALPAKAFSRQKGHVRWCNYTKTRFNAKDYYEDGRGDGRFVHALARATGSNPNKVPLSAAQLLKTCYQIITRHHRQTIMLLHRHNFTSFLGINLVHFYQALQQVCVDNAVLSTENFTRQVRIITMHKSKGLEAEVVMLLESDQKLLLGQHPHAGLFPELGDSSATELADNQRLVYVALTRAKKRLYLLSSDRKNLLG